MLSIRISTSFGGARGPRRRRRRLIVRAPRSSLASRTPSRGAPFDLVRRLQGRAAALAGPTGASVHGELRGIASALAVGVAEIAEGRAAEGDRVGEDHAEGAEERLALLTRERAAPS